MKKYYDIKTVKHHVPCEAIPEEVRAQFLRPGELLSILDKFPVAFQPLGTLEWHGRQNPLGCDALKAEKLAVEVAKQIGGVVMPPIYFATDTYRNRGLGMGLGMDSTAGFKLPGSFYPMDGAMYTNLIINACQNYLDRGFKFVILISGHNGISQTIAINQACYHFKENEGKEPVVFIMEYDPMDDDDPLKQGDHAAYYETSMMLYHFGDRVNMDANLNTEIENLAIGGKPYQNASYEDGEAFFNAQVTALKKYAVNKYNDYIKE